VVLDKIIKDPELSQKLYADLTQADTALVASMAETVRKQWGEIEHVQKMFGAKQ
jgi:hypothetical protein